MLPFALYYYRSTYLLRVYAFYHEENTDKYFRIESIYVYVISVKKRS